MKLYPLAQTTYLQQCTVSLLTFAIDGMMKLSFVDPKIIFIIEGSLPDIHEATEKETSNSYIPS